MGWFLKICSTDYFTRHSAGRISPEIQPWIRCEFGVRVHTLRNIIFESSGMISDKVYEFEHQIRTKFRANSTRVVTGRHFIFPCGGGSKSISSFIQFPIDFLEFKIPFQTTLHNQNIKFGIPLNWWRIIPILKIDSYIFYLFAHD
jgi:hypothetical protein